MPEDKTPNKEPIQNTPQNNKDDTRLRSPHQVIVYDKDIPNAPVSTEKGEDVEFGKVLNEFKDVGRSAAPEKEQKSNDIDYLVESTIHSIQSTFDYAHIPINVKNYAEMFYNPTPESLKRGLNEAKKLNDAYSIALTNWILTSPQGREISKHPDLLSKIYKNALEKAYYEKTFLKDYSNEELLKKDVADTISPVLNPFFEAAALKSNQEALDKMMKQVNDNILKIRKLLEDPNSGLTDAQKSHISKKLSGIEKTSSEITGYFNNYQFDKLNALSEKLQNDFNSLSDDISNFNYGNYLYNVKRNQELKDLSKKYLENSKALQSIVQGQTSTGYIASMGPEADALLKKEQERIQKENEEIQKRIKKEYNIDINPNVANSILNNTYMPLSTHGIIYSLSKPLLSRGESAYSNLEQSVKDIDINEFQNIRNADLSNKGTLSKIKELSPSIDYTIKELGNGLNAVKKHIPTYSDLLIRIKNNLREDKPIAQDDEEINRLLSSLTPEQRSGFYRYLSQNLTDNEWRSKIKGEVEFFENFAKEHTGDTSDIGRTILADLYRGKYGDIFEDRLQRVTGYGDIFKSMGSSFTTMLYGLVGFVGTDEVKWLSEFSAEKVLVAKGIGEEEWWKKQVFQVGDATAMISGAAVGMIAMALTTKGVGVGIGTLLGRMSLASEVMAGAEEISKTTTNTLRFVNLYSKAGGSALSNMGRMFVNVGKFIVPFENTIESIQVLSALRRANALRDVGALSRALYLFRNGILADTISTYAILNEAAIEGKFVKDEMLTDKYNAMAVKYTRDAGYVNIEDLDDLLKKRIEILDKGGISNYDYRIKEAENLTYWSNAVVISLFNKVNHIGYINRLLGRQRDISTGIFKRFEKGTLTKRYTYFNIVGSRLAQIGLTNVIEGLQENMQDIADESAKIRMLYNDDLFTERKNTFNILGIYNALHYGGDSRYLDAVRKGYEEYQDGFTTFYSTLIGGSLLGLITGLPVSIRGANRTYKMLNQIKGAMNEGKALVRIGVNPLFFRDSRYSMYFPIIDPRVHRKIDLSALSTLKPISESGLGTDTEGWRWIIENATDEALKYILEGYKMQLKDINDVRQEVNLQNKINGFMTILTQKVFSFDPKGNKTNERIKMIKEHLFGKFKDMGLNMETLDISNLDEQNKRILERTVNEYIDHLSNEVTNSMENIYNMPKVLSEVEDLVFSHEVLKDILSLPNRTRIKRMIDDIEDMVALDNFGTNKEEIKGSIELFRSLSPKVKEYIKQKLRDYKGKPSNMVKNTSDADKTIEDIVEYIMQSQHADDINNKELREKYKNFVGRLAMSVLFETSKPKSVYARMANFIDKKASIDNAINKVFDLLNTTSDDILDDFLSKKKEIKRYKWANHLKEHIKESLVARNHLKRIYDKYLKDGKLSEMNVPEGERLKEEINKLGFTIDFRHLGIDKVLFFDISSNEKDLSKLFDGLKEVILYIMKDIEKYHMTKEEKKELKYLMDDINKTKDEDIEALERKVLRLINKLEILQKKTSDESKKVRQQGKRLDDLYYFRDYISEKINQLTADVLPALQVYKYHDWAIDHQRIEENINYVASILAKNKKVTNLIRAIDLYNKWLKENDNKAKKRLLLLISKLDDKYKLLFETAIQNVSNYRNIHIIDNILNQFKKTIEIEGYNKELLKSLVITLANSGVGFIGIEAIRDENGQIINHIPVFKKTGDKIIDEQIDKISESIYDFISYRAFKNITKVEEKIYLENAFNTILSSISAIKEQYESSSVFTNILEDIRKEIEDFESNEKDITQKLLNQINRDKNKKQYTNLFDFIKDNILDVDSYLDKNIRDINIRLNSMLRQMKKTMTEVGQAETYERLEKILNESISNYTEHIEGQARRKYLPEEINQLEHEVEYLLRFEDLFEYDKFTKELDDILNYIEELKDKGIDIEDLEEGDVSDTEDSDKKDISNEPSEQPPVSEPSTPSTPTGSTTSSTPPTPPPRKKTYINRVVLESVIDNITSWLLSRRKDTSSLTDDLLSKVILDTFDSIGLQLSDDAFNYIVSIVSDFKDNAEITTDNVRKLKDRIIGFILFGIDKNDITTKPPKKHKKQEGATEEEQKEQEKATKEPEEAPKEPEEIPEEAPELDLQVDIGDIEFVSSILSEFTKEFEKVSGGDKGRKRIGPYMIASSKEIKNILHHILGLKDRGLSNTEKSKISKFLSLTIQVITDFHRLKPDVLSLDEELVNLYIDIFNSFGSNIDAEPRLVKLLSYISYYKVVGDNKIKLLVDIINKQYAENKDRYDKYLENRNYNHINLDKEKDILYSIADIGLDKGIISAISDGINNTDRKKDEDERYGQNILKRMNILLGIPIDIEGKEYIKRTEEEKPKEPMTPEGVTKEPSKEPLSEQPPVSPPSQPAEAPPTEVKKPEEGKTKGPKESEKPKEPDRVKKPDIPKQPKEPKKPKKPKEPEKPKEPKKPEGTKKPEEPKSPVTNITIGSEESIPKESFDSSSLEDVYNKYLEKEDTSYIEEYLKRKKVNYLKEPIDHLSMTNILDIYKPDKIIKDEKVVDIHKKIYLLYKAITAHYDVPDLITIKKGTDLNMALPIISKINEYMIELNEHLKDSKEEIVLMDDITSFKDEHQIC